jgi:cystathionine beta-lyase/cystathionine gamma-synthase
MVLGVSFGVSLAGVTATAYVSAANTVTIRLQNESAGTVNLDSTTIRVVVGRLA